MHHRFLFSVCRNSQLSIWFNQFSCHNMKRCRLQDETSSSFLISKFKRVIWLILIRRILEIVLRNLFMHFVIWKWSKCHLLEYQKILFIYHVPYSENHLGIALSRYSYDSFSLQHPKLNIWIWMRLIAVMDFDRSYRITSFCLIAQIFPIALG